MTAAVALLAVSGALVAGACLNGRVDGSVRLNDRVVDVAAPRPSPEATRARGTLRIAIAGIMSPSRTLDAYDQLVAYLQARLGTRVVVNQGSSYAEVNELLRTGQADIAFICSRAYVEGHAQFGLKLLLAPEVQGKLTYESYLIVPSDSTATSLADLRGERFAFSDPLSNSGRLALEYQLYLTGETPDTFFGSHEYTGSHDNSILAVADHIFDGAAVDSLVYQYVVAQSPDVGRRIRIIAKWGPYGMPPVVASPALSASMRDRVRDALLAMDQPVDGRAALAALGVERFVPIGDNAYDSIRAMLAALREAGR